MQKYYVSRTPSNMKNSTTFLIAKIKYFLNKLQYVYYFKLINFF